MEGIILQDYIYNVRTTYGPLEEKEIEVYRHHGIFFFFFFFLVQRSWDFGNLNLMPLFPGLYNIYYRIFMRCPDFG